ncbi:YdcH family protein [Campylobacter sp. MIT 21-1685]|uniref:YdcH family protein n=1 Tax=unclassified Campylobacter TaxID=2593542 RepID=UPI00224AAF3E|nr:MULTISPECIES: YdcH family protein [unclassified Campylobacter]MCX2682856.1 YdcH family protein [Campylobacter sp. MIT 21-1684]MCX2751196.1 YdcH family protein [Campylobacter sp. MIT 21-1682]MCX2807337.1 YdcH family protein [Campylobacter sp. MIT 21-1685]
MLHEYRNLMSELKGKDAHFDKLFEHHNKLDDKIKDAEEGRVFLSDMEISALKKEKLHTKDELKQYLQNYKQ